jgi:dihydrofolate reductase
MLLSDRTLDGKTNPEQLRGTTMGTITANTMITVNGVAEAPETWQFEYFSPEMAGVILDQLSRSSGLVLGRRTYEEFVGYWPHVSAAENPMAPAINELPKYVVSNTLSATDWTPSKVVAGDVTAQLRELRDDADGELSIIGSPTLVRSLLGERLIDRLSLMVFPVVVESGRSLFDGATTRAGLELLHADTLPNGVLHLAYQPAA